MNPPKELNGQKKNKILFNVESLKLRGTLYICMNFRGLVAGTRNCETLRPSEREEKNEQKVPGNRSAKIHLAELIDHGLLIIQAVLNFKCHRFSTYARWITHQRIGARTEFPELTVRSDSIFSDIPLTSICGPAVCPRGRFRVACSGQPSPV